MCIRDSAYLVGDAGGDALEHVVREASPVGRHRVLAGHGTKHHGVTVRAAVALDADGTYVAEQHHRELPDVAVEAGLRQLLPRDRVGLAEDVEPLPSDLADDADAQTGAGEPV